MSFNTKLTNLLKTDSRFVDDDGELIIAAVMDATWRVDHTLVKLLLSDRDCHSASPTDHGRSGLLDHRLVA
jgi:hypothetical protein